MRYLYIVFFGVMTFAVQAQTYNVGIRAGQNFATIRGAEEENESLEFSGGFHFGISFQVNVAENFGIKTEILYNQNGYNQKFVGEGIYMIRKPSGGVVFERGNMDLNLVVSNAYLHLPVTAHLKINNRWEVYGGIYGGILIGPTGRGLLRFESIDHPDEILFRQSLDYNFNSNEAGGITFNQSRSPKIRVDGEIIDLPPGVGAYYQFLDKRDNLFKKFDYGLNLGANYYLNRGFYVGMKVDYGLADITNQSMDRSLNELNPDNSYLQRDDKDRVLSFQVSFGFKF